MKMIASILGTSLVLSPALAQDAPAPLPAMVDAPCPPPAPPPPPRPATPPTPAQREADNQAYQRRVAAQRARDFPWLCRFKADNAALAPGSTRIVFMGDSITEGWKDTALFAPGVVNRGISGQTTPQMLGRFYQDVIALRPRVVHIMAGTNNVAGNTGPSTPEDFKNDIRAMADLAKANGIAAVIASIPPADRFFWRQDIQPAAQIKSLNGWLRSFAAERGLVYADYYTAMTTPSGAMKPEYARDGVHPTLEGYGAMRKIAEAALQEAARR